MAIRKPFFELQVNNTPLDAHFDRKLQQAFHEK